MYQPNPLHPERERENSKIINLIFSIIIIIIILINFEKIFLNKKFINLGAYSPY